MTQLRLVQSIIALLLLGALLGPPSRAQTSPGLRFPLADTTLLRDTLDLRFVSLFETAESLGVRPDTLRALSIRCGCSLERLVALADSLRVPVDSVGPVLERARFNPLAHQVERLTSFRYGSTYNISQTSSVWGNTSDYSFIFGPVFVQNNTDISMDRRTAGGRVGLRQNRSSVTEVGWKFSPDFSLGGRANLSRFNNLSNTGANRDAETKDEYQVTLHSRQAPSEAFNSELNFFTGVLDVHNVRQDKSGLSSDLSGLVHTSKGTWFTHDLDGQVTGNLSRSRVPDQVAKENTRDFSTNLRGTLGLFPASRVSGNVGYNLHRTHVESPNPGGGTEKIRTSDDALNASTRFRLDGSRYLNVTESIGSTGQATALSPADQSTRHDQSLGLSGAYRIGVWNLNLQFANGHSTTEYPARDTSGGYREVSHPRSIDFTATRPVTSRVTLLASGGVSLSSFRYQVIRNYPSPPVSRDSYRQYYRVDTQYILNVHASTGVTLEVSRTLDINIPSASTAANSQQRAYRAEWRWSYQLLEGLTATQRNQVIANYLEYSFIPSNNRLTLDYNSITTLNAVITRRLRVDLTHTTRQQPGGNYGPIDGTGTAYFSQADESRNLTLSSTISYAPAPPLSLTLQTDYYGSDRDGTANGVTAPQRENRSLNFSGGANLNIPLGGRGQLTGNINRTFRSDRSTNFKNGIPELTPTSRTDYWNGRLAFSWQM